VRDLVSEAVRVSGVSKNTFDPFAEAPRKNASTCALVVLGPVETSVVTPLKRS
jgi:hypothetical protein